MYRSKKDCVGCGYPIYLDQVASEMFCKCGICNVRVNFKVDYSFWQRLGGKQIIKLVMK